MDPLTPNKIQRLMDLAADVSFNMSNKRLLLQTEDYKRLGPSASGNNKESGACESSSGLLDLDQLQAFGDSDMGSISKSTGFHPGEMTGRSTGADDSVPKYRHSCFNMDSLTNELNKQTYEVQDIMRHSIATNYSCHSKNLTADEASFIARNAPLPLQQTHTHFQETSTINNSEMSVGAYFRNRCPEFGKVLTQTDSPDRSSMRPSLTEVSSHMEAENLQLYNLDPSLDSIPVRQPRNPAEQVVGHQAAKMMDMHEKSNRLPASKKEPMKDSFKIPNATSMGSVPKLEPQKQMKSSTVPDMRKMTTANKGTDLYMKAITQSSIKVVNDETEGSIIDSSLSISKIAEILGNQSVVRVSDILNQFKKDPPKRLPESSQMLKQEVPVTYLKDTRNVVSATSAGSVQTVISQPTKQESAVPEVVVTLPSPARGVHNAGAETVKAEYATTKSPSSKSRSTLSTVHENRPESPLHSSTGEVNTSHVPSPNIEYKELDKSVDWHEVMQQKRRRQQGLAKEQWAEISATPISGFVGVSCAASVSITTLTDSYVTATFYFNSLPNQGRDLRIDLPRQPLLLLSPGKTEELLLHITSSAEMHDVIPFTVSLKDSSIDSEVEHKGSLEVNFKMPVVQAMSLDGVNKVTFPPTMEKTFLTKSFVLISDSPVDLELSLSVVGGKNMFAIKNVQEIRTSEVNRVLKEQSSERQPSSKLRHKALNKQLCRLTRGNAIRATVTFEAPSLSDHSGTKVEVYTGAICVNLIGVETTIKKVDLTATVGTATLAFSAADDKLFLTKELNTLNVRNTGSVSAVWLIKTKTSEDRNVFNVSENKLELAPGETKALILSYSGPDDSVNTGTLIFEEVITRTKTLLELSGGAEKPKHFPIKTNCSMLSWIRSGRKEISLKNSTQNKVKIRCKIVGEAFSIDMPGADARGTCCIIQFNPNECRPLAIVYSPTTYLPNAASLHLMFDKNSEYSRKMSLFGCASGDPLRWSGLATYGETALVRAEPRAEPRAALRLALANRAPAPAFVCARVSFNLQYMSVAGACRLEGARRVVAARGAHALALRVDWARVLRRAQEARAPTLATLTALTGPELTRRRILRILRSECNGELDPSLLPENLRMLVGPFEGEDANMDALLADFHENRSSLVELIGGLQELKAQIDLPQDIADETIIIADDTVIEHHTLYELE